MSTNVDDNLKSQPQSEKFRINRTESLQLECGDTQLISIFKIAGDFSKHPLRRRWENLMSCIVEICLEVFGGEVERRRLLESAGRRWDDNIKIHRKK
jgi:hypothetical protein